MTNPNVQKRAGPLICGNLEAFKGHAWRGAQHYAALRELSEVLFDRSRVSLE